MPRECARCRVLVIPGTNKFDIRVFFEQIAPVKHDFTSMKVTIAQGLNEQTEDLLADFNAAWEEGKMEYSFTRTRAGWYVVGNEAASTLRSQFSECISKNPVEV